MFAAANALLPPLGDQRFVQWNRLQVGHVHGAGEADSIVQLVELTHGFVEDGGDDAAVRMLGRPDELPFETEFADETLTLLVEDELQPQPVLVLGTAAKTLVAELTFLNLMTGDCLVPWHVTKMKQSRWKMQEGRLSAVSYQRAAKSLGRTIAASHERLTPSDEQQVPRLRCAPLGMTTLMGGAVSLAAMRGQKPIAQSRQQPIADSRQLKDMWIIRIA